MDNKLSFRPVIGTNAQILKQHPTAGYVWFATDTKKIYYSDGTSFLSMGGNTGIYYGIKIIPDDTDSDQTEFIFSIMEIDGNDMITDGNYKIPNKDDLILNIPDGCFYRVDGITESNDINTVKLTIAGGGGSTGGATGYLAINDVDNSFIKYFTTDAKEAVLRFRVNNPIQQENNGIVKITYNIGAIATIEDTDYKDFGVVEFDLLPYLSKMTTSAVNKISIQVVDAYNTKKTVTYSINVVKLSLSSGYKNSILMTDTGKYDYTCLPSGGTTLNDREIIIAFYDVNNNHLNNDIIKPVTIANSELPIEIDVPQIGTFTMMVTYRGKLPTGNWVNSNSLIYQMVYYNEIPQLVVNVPTTKVEQYSVLNITYMVAAKTNSVDKLEVKLYKGNSESIQEIEYNTLNTWSIYFDTPGFYDLTIETIGITRTYPNIEVYSYAGKIPAINTSGLTLNLSAINRSNTELNKDSWTYGDYKCDFSKFAWGQVNGWMKDEAGQDMLHLSAGAKLEVSNFFPYNENAMIKGQTIELDFKITGVTDFSKGLIECLSYQNDNIIQTGFQVTGQGSTLNTLQIKATGGSIKESDDESLQIYNTQIQGCTAKFVENKRIHLTWVVESSLTNEYPMIKTYLNGILSGITQYGSEDQMIQNNARPAKIIFDSTYGNIDIYNIRVYKNAALSDNVVLDNYIATAGSIEDRTHKYEDNASVLDDNNKISIEKIEAENINSGYILSVPYIKIIGGQGMEKDDEGYYLNNADNDYRLPNAKKDYRLIQKYEFIDMSGERPEQILNSTFDENGYLNGLAMYGQGTSSMEYPVKNLRIKSKMKINNEKVKFLVNDCEVDLVCLKADYMESSGSHNTGTGNLIYNLTKSLGLQTPGQEYWQDKVNYDVVSAIRGFPILVFFKEANKDENEPYEFIGKYNFNLDKATHEPFGFNYDKNSDFGWTPNEYKTVNIINEKSFNGYPFDLFIKENDNYIKAESYIKNTQYYTIKNHVHCYEFLNNASNLANFLSDDNLTFEETFNKIIETEDKELVPNWFASYESRYPEFEDAESTDIDSWFRLCNWINSTENNLDKFVAEFDDYLDFDFTCFYYILTHVLLMIDSRAKNMMMATWDDKIWYPIFYDMDTMLGLNNYGYNKFHYDVEDKDVNIYNGQASILWNNFKAAFPTRIAEFYQRMQTAGLTYNNLLKNYNEKQADAINEIIYNNDSKYKYIRPFTEPFIDNSGDETVIVQPGARDYLYASQGNRSMHREWWLKNRINYFNGKYLSDAYKKDRYVLRLYTPSATEDNYFAVPDLDEETFILNKTLYYTRIGEEGSYIFIPVEETDSFNSEITYYKKAPNALKESVIAVPPSNSFELIPLNNQYLSIAFGGDNGITTNPLYVKANTKQIIDAPDGAVYNDTETYLYGGSSLKDLGDLSYQYLGRFVFPETSETKLEKLTLGNPNNKYYNPNFSLLTIGAAAPYLKELEISNCSGLSGRGIDVSKCKNIQNIYATGTGISNITLPPYGVLKELRLPNTINSLTLIEQSQLTNDKFTIGSCLYYPDSKTKTYTNHSGNIIILRVENTPIDSYSLVKDNPIQQFYLKGINWIISDIDDLNEDKTEINVLEKLLSENTISAIPGQNKSQSLMGTITLDESLGLTEQEAMVLYIKYCNSEAFPNINLVFNGLNIHDVIILNGNGTELWRRKIIGNDNGTINITREFLEDNTFGIFTLPTKSETIQYNYKFTNIWSFNNIEYNCSNNDPIGWPIINNIYPVDNTVVLIPKFKENIREYEIIFKNPYDSTFGVNPIVAPYGTKISNILPRDIPYRNDSLLPLTDTYSHIGYNINENAMTAIDFTDNDIVTGNKTYYAIFNQINVYENIHYDYFNLRLGSFEDPESKVINQCYILSPKNNTLQGKITIPAFYEDIPIGIVEGFKGNTKITHVFVAGNNLKEIGYEAFMKCSNLEYLDFPNSLRKIENNAVRETKLKPINGIYYFGNNLYSIGTYAFNQINYNGAYTIQIPSSVTEIGGAAFSFGTSRNVSIEIGTNDNPSKLDLTKGTPVFTSNSGNMMLFEYNNPSIENVIFYSENYSEWETSIIKNNTQTATVANWLGRLDAKTGYQWELKNGENYDQEEV